MSTDIEITVTSTPAVIDTNYEALKARLSEEMEKYDIVVTEDTIADAKRSAADINKLKASLAERRKQEVATASEPVKEFDAKFRELEEMCDEARKKIVAQTKKFEEETLVKAQEKVDAEIASLYDELGVRDGYRAASVKAILSHLTAKGALSAVGKKAAKEAVQERAAAQSRRDLREANLEIACHRAGLTTPLTVEYISGFVDTKSDEHYEHMLGELISKEVARQEQAEQKQREKIRAEEAEKAAQAAREAEAARAPEPDNYYEAPPVFDDCPEPTADDVDDDQAWQTWEEYQSGEGEVVGVDLADAPSDTIWIVCTLETVRPEGMSDDEIIEYTRNRLANEAGITTLKTISIRSAQ